MRSSIEANHLRLWIHSILETGRDSPYGSSEVLKGRSKDRGLMIRLSHCEAESFIVKVWRIRGWSERIKSLLGVSLAQREWRVHRHLKQSGLMVPRLVQFLRVPGGSGRLFEVIVVEDLGPTRNGLVYLKDLLEAGNEEAIRSFEASVLDMTSQLLKAGIVDVDHQLRNIVVDGRDQPIRIDFECARRFFLGFPPLITYALMIGRLVVSHAYACQPALTRTECFARRLAEHLHPPRAVLNRADAHVRQELSRQRDTTGLDSRLRLDW